MILHRAFIAVCVTVVLAVALPAAAEGQTRRAAETVSEVRVVEAHGSRRVEVRLRGAVTLNEAGDWIEALAPGAEAIVEARDGGLTRRTRFTSPGAGVVAEYSENGRVLEMDAAARAWTRGVLQHATREGGLGVEQRVERLRARGGVSAVLREAGRMRTDAGKRRYAAALLAGAPLSAREVRQTMAFVAREISSDTDRRLVLTGALRRGPFADAAAEPFLEVVDRMRSDTDRRLVLTAMIDRGLVRGGGAAPFYRSVGRIGSGTDRRLVLSRLVSREGAAALPDGFFSAVDGMASGTDQRLVLSAVLRADPPETVTLAALRSTGAIRGDRDRRLVLAQVPAGQLRTPRVAAAYRDAAARIDARSERELALRRLGPGF